MNHFDFPAVRRWPFRSLVLLSIIAVTAAVWWYYLRQRTAMEAASVQELSVVADAERKQIAAWRRERLGDGRLLLNSPLMPTLIKALSGPRILPSEGEDLLKVMATLKREFGYSNAVLVDPTGTIRVALRNDAAQLGRSALAELCQEGVSAGDVFLSDLDQYNGQRRLITLTVPVRRLGAMILEIDPSTFLYPLLKSWPGPSRTGETMLVRLEGADVVYLSERRYASRLPGRRTIQFRLSSDSKMDSGIVLRGPDYRGVNVLMEARRVPDSSWYVAAKIDAAEVNAPIARLGREMASILIALDLAIGAGAAWLQKSRQLRLQHESEQRFRAIADDTPAFLWMASPGEQDFFLNKPFQAFLGANGQNLTDWTRYVHPDDVELARSSFATSMAGARPCLSVFRIRRFDGEYRMCVSEALPRFSPARELIGVAGSVIDITEQTKAEHKLTEANAALSQELEEKTEREKEIRALSARLIHAQEEERRRLSRELHDDLSQQIAALSIGMGNLKRGLPEQQTQVRLQTDRIQQKLVGLSEAVRRLSHELHPAVLQHSGLRAALRAYCHEFEALTRIRVRLQTDGDFDGVPPAAALNMYRITQEAVGNVAKHARVEQAEVDLTKLNGELCLTISDHGVGIGANQKTGLGLVSIRERARLMGGVMEIQNLRPQGTRLTITIPEPTGESQPQTGEVFVS
jgi:PAS domain S-box-containing protein